MYRSKYRKSMYILQNPPYGVSFGGLGYRHLKKIPGKAFSGIQKGVSDIGKRLIRTGERCMGGRCGSALRPPGWTLIDLMDSPNTQLPDFHIPLG